MRVHVFGNSPSPSIANYCLLKTAESAKNKYGQDVADFVSRSFYVDDGLLSSPSPEHAIDLMTKTREALNTEGHLRLHKIASNSRHVMDAFPKDDIAGDLQDIDLGSSDSPMQRSLGLFWNLQTDCFTFKVSDDEKPFTRRGVLSVVNSLYDPLGFIAPIVVQGKHILREVMQTTKDWDEPLPDSMRSAWDTWRQSLHALDNLSIPRSYVKMGFSHMMDRKIFVYTDASEKAVATVAFLKATDATGQVNIGFIMGKAKVAPLNGHSIPRLELCAALMGIQIAEVISSELDIDMDSFHFFSDSKVTLGYICNNSKRFYMYVANRVARIRKTSKPNQWFYVQSQLNPADVGTRPVLPDKLQQSMWLQASEHIMHQEEQLEDQTHVLVDPSSDKEVRVLKSDFNDNKRFSLTPICEKFSSWNNLVNAIKILKTRVGKTNQQSSVAEIYDRTINYIIREIQSEIFKTELECVKNKLPLPKSSRIRDLNPLIDSEGVLRVGGRINKADIDYSQKHPIIIPGNHHLATLLIRHYHVESKHQGRHFTAGAIRSAGLWIVGQSRLISSLIHSCVICRKLRGKREQQLMSDLPADRVTPSAPFSVVGIDTFGPWQVTCRKTRGGQSKSKRWALMFTCLSTRGIHIEVIEELSTSSFINALRRTISLRGSIREIRSDRGTNFVGSTNHLDINTINVEDGPVKKFLEDKRTTWKFNSPHSSHMGGVWERMIGITRRILDSMIHEVQTKTLTHEVLTTFLAEVCAIVNGRPIVPLSSDPEAPEALTPSMILTQKSGFDPILIGSFDTTDLYRAHWRRVQHLANCFWKRWTREYLNTLQTRRKWNDIRQNLKEGDIVLVKDNSIPRNEWPLGVVVTPLPSEDDKVRKATIRLGKNGSTYTRPISEIVLLLSE